MERLSIELYHIVEVTISETEERLRGNRDGSEANANQLFNDPETSLRKAPQILTAFLLSLYHKMQVKF